MSMRSSTKVIFTLSVLLNVVLIGVVAGGVIKDLRKQPWHQAKEELSPESRSIVARNFRATHNDMRDIREQSQKLREQMKDIFKAEVFDVEAFDKAALKMDELKQKMHQRKIESIRELAQSLPQEERVKMADKLARGMEPRKPGQKRGKNAEKRGRDWSPPQPQTIPVPLPDSKPEGE